jgi:hypothetical protein
VAAWNTYWHWKIRLGDWAVPNFMAAFALPDEETASGLQYLT